MPLKRIMKRPSFSKFLVLTIATALVAAGCKTPPPSLETIPRTGPPVVAEPVASPPINTVPRTVTPLPFSENVQPPVNPPAGLEGGHPLSQIPTDWTTRQRDINTFKGETVYFDFDRSNVKTAEKAKIETVANFLKDPAHAGDDLVVEGNCDERGTEQYNLALGDRRALSVREALIALGISADKIHTVSFGLSHPAVIGHNEAAWSKNRRDDFVLVLPAQAAQ